jgi:hypothetical protein
MGQISIELSGKWISSEGLENHLNLVKDTTFQDCTDLLITVPNGGNLMVDAGVRLLSYLNQLHKSGKKVCLNFEDGKDGAFGYMDRIGFFDHLEDGITTIPERPNISSADIFRGNNSGVLEIIPIDPINSPRDSFLPTTLANKLLSNILDEEIRASFDTPCYTFFAELVENIYLHSQTELKGFIAFQVYKKGTSVKVAVSDSGIGLLTSLRTKIEDHYPQYKDADDAKLIELMFSEGLSKDGVDKGCGLKTCAKHALKFHATLDVRLPHSRFHLTPMDSKIFGYEAQGSITKTTLDFAGTHITLDMRLDK